MTVKNQHNRGARQRRKSAKQTFTNVGKRRTFTNVSKCRTKRIDSTVPNGTPENLPQTDVEAQAFARKMLLEIATNPKTPAYAKVSALKALLNHPDGRQRTPQTREDKETERNERINQRALVLLRGGRNE